MRARAVSLVTVATLLAAGPALAQPGQTPPAPPPPPGAVQPPPPGYPMTMRRTKRYGSKIATVDGLSLGGMFVGAIVFAFSVTEDFDDNGDEDGDAGVAIGAGLMIAGGLGLVFGGPLIHNREGNTSGAWKSLGLRLGIPLVGGLLIGAMTDESCDSSVDEDCNRGAETASTLLGLAWVGGIVLDWFYLARVEVDAPVYPYAAPTPHGGVSLGLTGRL
jgi:hypothetical protein